MTRWHKKPKVKIKYQYGTLFDVDIVNAEFRK